MRLALALIVLALAASPAQAQEPGCIGETDASAVTPVPGPALRFGITPGVQTGQLGTGPAPPRTPEDPVRHLAALRALQPPGRDLVLRLHRFFWSDGEEGIRRFLALADRYTSSGFLVELQLRYHPAPEQEGDIPAWVAYVRDVVRRFGSNPRVVAIQVTNEVNLTFSPDSSDGAYEGAREALVQGVIAAKDQARRMGSAVEIGFNWAYRADPAQDTSFWNALRDRGGKPFVDSLDWVGVDAYPGTLFPPAHTPGGERDGMVNAFDSARCFMAIPGIPPTVPIHVEENGWPTSPSRSEDEQVRVMDTMVRATHDFRGTYNITDYRWFNLRDGDSTSPNYQVRYGLLRDDYSEKPGFATFRNLIAELGRVAPGRPRAKASRIGVRVFCRRGAPRVRVRGARLRAVMLRVGRRRVRDARRPFDRRVPRGRRVHIEVLRANGSRAILSRRLARCRRLAR